MATRADIITQSSAQLGDIAVGMTTTDSAPNIFHYALNSSLAQMEKADSDVSSFTTNQVRTAVIGVSYYVCLHRLTLWWRLPYEQETIQQNTKRREFERLTKYCETLKEAFLAALAGDDIPSESLEYAETIKVWTNPDGEDAEQRLEEVDDLGQDFTDYLNNDD